MVFDFESVGQERVRNYRNSKRVLMEKKFVCFFFIREPKLPKKAGDFAL